MPRDSERSPELKTLEVAIMEECKTEHPPLTLFRIFYDDGDHTDTNMASFVTLQEAKDHFIGKEFERHDGKMRTATKVIQIIS